MSNHYIRAMVSCTCIVTGVTFQNGDVLKVVEEIDKDWWLASSLQSAKKGLVPKSCFEILPANEVYFVENEEEKTDFQYTSTNETRMSESKGTKVTTVVKNKADLTTDGSDGFDAESADTYGNPDEVLMFGGRTEPLPEENNLVDRYADPDLVLMCKNTGKQSKTKEYVYNAISSIRKRFSRSQRDKPSNDSFSDLDSIPRYILAPNLQNVENEYAKPCINRSLHSKYWELSGPTPRELILSHDSFMKAEKDRLLLDTFKRSNIHHYIYTGSIPIKSTDVYGIENEPYFAGKSSREEVEERLWKMETKSFLLRERINNVRINAEGFLFFSFYQ